MRRLSRTLAAAGLVAAVAGCAPDYSPDKYAPNAVQQENKADQGVVVGVRSVEVLASGTTGAAAGAGAGGIAGTQTPGGGVASAFGAIGGALVGGIVGSAAEKAVGDQPAYEYIVRKTNGDLVAVTQRDKTPLTVGMKVLVIAGSQARVLQDYTVPVPAGPGTPTAGKAGPEKPAGETSVAVQGGGATTATAPAPGPVVATPLAPVDPAAVLADPVSLAPAPIPAPVSSPPPAPAVVPPPPIVVSPAE